MDRLNDTLLTLMTLLNELQLILLEEARQLRQLNVNPAVLHALAENKNHLLSALALHDEKRKELENALHTYAPYPVQSGLAEQWKQVSTLVGQTAAHSDKIKFLLELHMQKNKQLRQVFNLSALENPLYGPAGEKENSAISTFSSVSI